MTEDSGKFGLSSKKDLSSSLEPPKSESKRRLKLRSSDATSPTHSAADVTDSVRSTSRLSFFRALIGQRNDDYRSDAPQEFVVVGRDGEEMMVSAQAPSGTTYSSNRSSRAKLTTRWSLRPPQEEQLTLQQLLSGCWRSMVQHNIPGVLNSKLWQAGLVFFTLVLLFGSQIQALWVPKEGDTFFDVLFMVDFAFFLVDICMRCLVEEAYCHFQLCQKDDSTSTWGSCRLGSFMFWCDVISTFLLLYDVTFINKTVFDTATIDITLDGFGFVIGGTEEINTALPIRWQPSLIVTVLRTTRVARFIRASTVVKTSSMVNWYWIFQWFNPLCYLELLKAFCSRKFGKKQKEPEEVMPVERSGSADAWGTLALGAMSAVQAKQQAKMRQKGVKGFLHSCLVRVGILPNEEQKIQERIVAATKIQRAWRSFASTELGDVDDALAANSPSVHNSAKSADGVSLNQRPPRSSNTIGRTIRRSFDRPSDKQVQESQVGSAMRELTGQRVAVGVILSMILTILFTYSENDATRPSTMIVLHGQTVLDAFANQSLNAARASSVPDLFEYQAANGKIYTYDVSGDDPDDLRDWELLMITIQGGRNSGIYNGTTIGRFTNREQVRDAALVELLTTIFILFIWFFGVTAFAGPVMTLVVIPIERMIRLLGMLMMDPLGYQSSSRYKNFVNEEDQLTKKSRWTKEVLKGMETSFLMSTITRIGSLMKVGFGSAGVEIIRNNLQKGQKKDTLLLNSQGSTVACIFLFCDIRQFTDATESLQEEVFLFTNKIAAVVHSFCHAYGGSANKNVGDAFLLSWMLEDEGRNPVTNSFSDDIGGNKTDTFTAKKNQADRALFSVVKICIALQHDEYYIEAMSPSSRDALLSKLENREGPVVQMGFGLHAGKAIQGALGSQRKIDATYVSEAVERAEFLESSTKKYGVKLLMSDSFYRLLQQTNRTRCRKIDHILLNDEESEESFDNTREYMELFTFDMDMDALTHEEENAVSENESSLNESSVSVRGSKRAELSRSKVRRRSIKGKKAFAGLVEAGGEVINATIPDLDNDSQTSIRGDSEGGDETNARAPLVLPTGPALFNPGVWSGDDIKAIRLKFNDGVFYPRYQSGLQSYYAKDWQQAKQCFEDLVRRYNDGPSKYFLKEIEDNNGVPPRDFVGYQQQFGA